MIKTVNAVECKTCKKIFKEDSEQFISVHGNVCIGLGGGIIGNNIEENQVTSVSIFCKSCFSEIMFKYIKDEFEYLYDIRDECLKG